ncbi:MAG: ATPase, partial [Actinomycetes bacterium]
MSDTEREATEVSALTGPSLSSTTVMRAGDADVGASRESKRRHRLRVMAVWLGIPALYLWYRILSGNPAEWGLPSIDAYLLVPILFFSALLLIIVGTTVGAGRSPHVMYRPEQISTRLDDVKGIDPVKDEVIRSLNLFLAHKA